MQYIINRYVLSCSPPWVIIAFVLFIAAFVSAVIYLIQYKDKRKTVNQTAIFIILIFSSMLSYSIAYMIIPEWFCFHNNRELARILLREYAEYELNLPEYDTKIIPLFWDYNKTLDFLDPDGARSLIHLVNCPKNNPPLFLADLDLCSFSSYWYLKYQVSDTNDLKNLKDYLIHEVYSEEGTGRSAKSYGLRDLFLLIGTDESKRMPLLIEKPSPYLNHKHSVSFLDGHMERISLNEKWPVTEEVITTLDEIERHAVQFFRAR